MQGFSSVVGQPGAVNQLKLALSNGKVAHAYLFNGPKGTGKGLTAGIFARALNCEVHEDRPCDTCLACQKALHGNHPDIYLLRPEGTSLKIEQIRALQKRVYARAYEGNYKIFIIEDIDKATSQAGNSLLKILEEPPGKTVFILLANNALVIPATIVSRCQRVNFALLDTSAVFEILVNKGFDSEKASTAAALACGSPGEALRFASNDQLSALRNTAAGFLEGAFSKNYLSIFKVVNTLEKDKLEIAGLLEQMLLILRDIYFSKQIRAGALVADPDLALTLGQRELTPNAIKRAMETVLECMEFQRKQANSKILLDVLGCRLAKLA